MQGLWVLIGKSQKKPIKPTPYLTTRRKKSEKQKDKHRIRYRRFTRA